MRMIGIYPKLWADQFPTDEAYKISRYEWSLQIAKLSAYQIENGIQGCIGSGEKFPPTLPQFVKYALAHVETSRSLRKIYG